MVLLLRTAHAPPCRELLQAGFAVRAGVRDVEKAKQSLDVAAQYGIIPSDKLKLVTVVPFDLTDPSTIAAAIGNANKVRRSRPDHAQRAQTRVGGKQWHSWPRNSAVTAPVGSFSRCRSPSRPSGEQSPGGSGRPPGSFAGARV